MRPLLQGHPAAVEDPRPERAVEVEVVCLGHLGRTVRDTEIRVVGDPGRARAVRERGDRRRDGRIRRRCRQKQRERCDQQATEHHFLLSVIN